ncbi:MAG: hypothetical protein KC621_08685 [Myxococcales bacterium]|nr:hypothetical protein [Myxococcales bacterium]
MIDRFADGSPDAPGSVDREDPAAWHGGDLRGLIEHLDHLDRLGFGGVWLSPIADTRDAPIDGWGAFHGYWTEDPSTLEPRFGTEDDLRDLRRELDARGMELWLDVVWNHVGYDAPVLATHPDWFHGLGDVTDWDDPVQVVRHDVHGLLDLAQENDQAYAWLRDAALHWIDVARPDGLRVDAVRHLNPGFVRRIGDDLRAVDPSLELLGEVFDGDGGKVAAVAKAEALDEVFDFPLHYTLVDAMCRGGALGRVAGVLSPTLGGAVPVGMLDNHDLPRVASVCGEEGALRALAVLLTTRGRPSLTWGTEVPLLGEGEPANRADQPWGAPGRLEAALAELLALRAANPLLADAPTRTLWLDDDRWLFARGDERGTVVVAVQQRDEPWSPSLPLDAPPTRSVRVDGSGVTEAPPGLDGRGVWIGTWDALLPPEPRVSLELRVVGAPVGELRWVGATAALGGWTPERGKVAVDGVLSLTVPAGTVLVGKPVVVGEEGSVVWDAGPDQIVLAAGGQRGARSATAMDVSWTN